MIVDVMRPPGNITQRINNRIAHQPDIDLMPNSLLIHDEEQAESNEGHRSKEADPLIPWWIGNSHAMAFI
jgi:hypothetical protein